LGWLGHSDARQAFDLRELGLFLHAVFARFLFAVIDRDSGLALRQVGDLPRINVAKPPKSDVKILNLKN
jgi:hypothetical protein